MQAFDLYIEDRLRVDLDVIVFADVLRQTKFVLVLDLTELTAALRIVRQRLDFLDLRQICDPAITDVICHPLRQQGIAVQAGSGAG